MELLCPGLMHFLSASKSWLLPIWKGGRKKRKRHTWGSSRFQVFSFQVSRQTVATPEIADFVTVAFLLLFVWFWGFVLGIWGGGEGGEKWGEDDT